MHICSSQKGLHRFPEADDSWKFCPWCAVDLVKIEVCSSEVHYKMRDSGFYFCPICAENLLILDINYTINSSVTLNG
jgi:hypothetical protein